MLRNVIMSLIGGNLANDAELIKCNQDQSLLAYVFKMIKGTKDHQGK